MSNPLRRFLKKGPIPDVENLPPKPGAGIVTTVPTVADFINYTCGHTKPRKEFEGIACPECRAKARKAKSESKQARQAQKHAERADKGRLSHHATYVKRYDSDTKTWTATLFLPVEHTQFEATASGSIKVELELDRQYREWKEKNP